MDIKSHAILVLEKNHEDVFSCVPWVNCFISYFFLWGEIELLLIIKFDFLYFRKKGLWVWNTKNIFAFNLIHVTWPKRNRNQIVYDYDEWDFLGSEIGSVRAITVSHCC